MKKRVLLWIAVMLAVLATWSVFARETEREEAVEVTQDIQYVMYVGTNDRDTNHPVFPAEECLSRAKEILISHFGGYTIQEAHGGWVNDDGSIAEEYTMVIFLSDTTLDEVHSAADDMQKVFNQSSILIQANPTTTEFYSGS